MNPADFLQQLQKKNISIPQFQDYLDRLERFGSLSEALRHKGISLQDYHHYLTQQSTLAVIPALTLENQADLKAIQRCGVYLLQQKKISLESLNQILQEFSSDHWNLPYFLQLLIKYRKIKTEDLLTLLSTTSDASKIKESYQIRQTGERLEFFLKTISEKRFGVYQILEEIGRGGMGVIYKAYHPYLNQFHALKVLISGEKASALQGKRFLREIQTVARLKHPHIIQIYDSGETEGQPYFSMEYVEGKTLESLIQEGLSIRRGLKLIHQSLKALVYAHEQHVLHRDLKPANILVTLDDEAKLSDFGLAKDLTDPETHRLTQTGAILGSPVYMAPEQIQGEATDFRTDIYAMGVSLFQVLTKTLPFTGKSLEQLKQKVLQGDLRRPSDFRPEIHRNLDMIVLKALETKPENRYTRAQDFAEDIERFLQGKSPKHATSPTATRQILFWIKRNKTISGAFFFVLFLLSALTGFYLLSKSRLQTQQFTEVYQRIEPLLVAENVSASLPKTIPDYLKFLNDLNEALRIRFSEELQQTRLWVSEQLIQLACEFDHYHLVSYVLKDLVRFPLTASQQEHAKVLERKIEYQRSKRLKQNQKKLRAWLNRFRQNTISLEEKKDAIFEIAKMPEREIFQELLTLLKQELSQFRQPSLSPEYSTTFLEGMIQIIGRQGREEAEVVLIQNVSFLSSLIQKFPEEKRPISKIRVMIALIEALGNLPKSSHFQTITEVRRKMGATSLLFRQTTLAYKKLMRKLSPQDWRSVENLDRAMMKFDQGNYEEALEEHNQLILLYPEWSDLYNNRAMCKKNLGDLDGALQDLATAIQLTPNDYTFYLNRGMIYLRQNELTKALENFNTAVQLNSEPPEVYLSRGQVLLKLNQYPQAIEDFFKAIQKNPYYPEAYHDRGIGFQNIGKLQEALQDMDEAIRLEPKNSNFYNSRGSIKQEIGEIQEALQDYNRSIEINPKNTLPYLNRARLRQELKDIDGAILDYSHIRILEPENVHSYIETGLCYMQKNQYEKALAEYQQGLLYHPEDHYLLYNQGSAYHALGKYDLAFQSYSEALRVKPDFAEVYNNRGTLRREQGDPWQTAMSDYQKSKELDPRVAQTYFNIGSMYHEIGEITQAIDFYTQALTLDPEYDLVLLWRGRAYFDKEQYSEAEKDLQQLLQKNPKNSEALCFYGDLKRWTEGTEEALKYYEQAIFINPNNAEAYMKRGIIRRFQKQWNDSLNDFQQAITLAPKNSQIYLNRALLWMSQKKWEPAIEDCQYVLQHLPVSACFAWETMGAIYEEQEQKNKAIEAFEQALQLRPNRLPTQQKYIKLLMKRIIEKYRNQHNQDLLEDIEKFLKYAPPQHPERIDIEKLREQLLQKQTPPKEK